jgi:P27 family predicted phage terminase small subunit
MKTIKLWKAPSDLGEHGKRLWKSVGPRLVESGSLDNLDRETFETLCRVYHKMTVADRLLENEGLAVDGLHDTTKKHPAFTMWKAYSDLYLKLLSHFGLSPYSRGVKITPREEENSDGKNRFFK